MKAFIPLIILGAVGVVLACERMGAESKSSSQEIAIRAINATTAKSAIDGTVFQDGYDMLVSAYFNVGSLGAEDTPKNFFEGIRFAKNETTWKSTQGAKYYPIDGTLDFLAFSSAGLKDADKGVVPSAVWGAGGNVSKRLVLTVPDNSTKFDDLIYGAANAQGASAAGTGIIFNHAYSSVVFLPKCNVGYDADANLGITIDGITIDGAKYSGTLTVSNPAAGGGTGVLTAVWSNLEDQKTHLNARVWNSANTGVNVAEPSLSGLNLGTTTASLTDKPFGEAYVILPPQPAVPFTIFFTLHNGFKADGTTPQSTQHQYQVVPTGNWEMGKKNIYSLNFTLTEIRVVPSVADWDAAPVVTPIPN